MAKVYIYIYYSNFQISPQNTIDFTFLLMALCEHPALFLLNVFVDVLSSNWDAVSYSSFRAYLKLSFWGAFPHSLSTSWSCVLSCQNIKLFSFRAFSMCTLIIVVGNMISASLKPSLYTWKFSVHILLKPSLKDFEHNLASMWNECNCVVVWTFFGIALLWD